MTALLTDKLPLLAGAPNGIKKLRELILELAVRGKLVPQAPCDEPASDLLERIAEEKARLVAEGKIKKGKAVDDAIAEISYPIPSTWAVASLGQVVEIVRGITFPASEKSKEPESGRVACLRTANVQNEIEWDDLLFIRDSFISRPDQYIQPHDIVMSMANSRELVGKVALIGSALDQPTTFGGFLGVLRPVLIEPRFVMALLRTPHARSVLIDSASQTTNIANVSLAKLRPLPFAIPPLSEQQRIVAKIDELMALCDRLEAQQADAESAHARLVQALLDSLTQACDATDFAASWLRLAGHFHTLFTTESSIVALKQALLQLAVMGKLVPQDSSDEPASELLNKIAAERTELVKEGKLKKEKPFSEIKEQEFSFKTPKGWVWSRMGNLAQFQKGHAFKSEDYLNNGLLITKIQNLTENHTQNAAYINPERFSEFEKYLILEGDIVMTTVGSWFSAPTSAVGRSFLINNLFDNSLLNQNAVRVRCLREINTLYLFNYINSTIFKKYLIQEAQGTANQASITQDSIKKFLICLPPEKEQHRIVAKVDKLMALCDQLKTRLKQARQLNEQLASTLIEQTVA
ncbi:restriction endonuclease subunit S [Pseudomonas fluorescens]|uniref:Type I restriction modification DNA specificity domain-containing protein n=1 Tax=Pseudomonas fluorescens TaxID=294 RepID=A0A5E6SGG1_PSEFL|nr:restriction endonuclease subunit S [Pseudomonas fluorescens]VVM75148.1 hypothetical protein PS659_02048 [Pseudomonas fluorescens]